MYKKLFLLFLGCMLLSSCTKAMTKEQYIDMMVALGCKGAVETSPKGVVILNKKGVTLEDIANFRKKMNPDEIMTIVKEIAKRVAECHGVKQN